MAANGDRRTAAEHLWRRTQADRGTKRTTKRCGKDEEEEEDNEDEEGEGDAEDEENHENELTRTQEDKQSRRRTNRTRTLSLQDDERTEEHNREWVQRQQRQQEEVLIVVAGPTGRPAQRAPQPRLSGLAVYEPWRRPPDRLPGSAAWRRRCRRLSSACSSSFDGSPTYVRR